VSFVHAVWTRATGSRQPTLPAPAGGRTLAINSSTKGYQRKGMRSEFYEDFENCKFYFDIASVIKSKLYLEVSVNRPDLAETFQKDFIDNFVESESFFFASW
jgi:hypothetical protein